MRKVDCIIIGAGLSGLAAALTLTKASRSLVLVERDAEVGGRIKSTFYQKQFLLDHGFQVLLRSYPELKNFIDLKTLDLKKFNSGALIYTGAGLDLVGNPIVHPSTIFSSLTSSVTTLRDKFLIIKLVSKSLLCPSDTPMGNESTKDFLKNFGFSSKMIEFFWTPFLAGVFLDHDLKSGKDFFLFLMRCFSLGGTTVPALGMAELPKALASQIPAENIYLNEKVQSWKNNEVYLSSGEVIKADAVICAFDLAEDIKYSNVTTYYFTGQGLNQVNWGKWLILVPRKYNLSFDNMCLMSAVSNDYGKNQPLLSVSVVGIDRGSVNQISADINQVAGFDLRLELISSYPILKALPKSQGHPQGFDIRDQVIYCGDRWTSPSINGALKSGRLAAEYFLAGKLS
ncbi:MAG: FAD-dependent oxidoreductase [Moraxellaceae bacterium]|nr:FAD-dependent oxidoreductase [Pseudobdellovibrionaceae bacterium]